ncbi:hypothetical protein KGM_211198 [Danaus plexippus plexippus]|uniref:Uncharacterized protein n=1 Tax=Danaus plexippus plexippus TaxID=278856 RepID=A0A212FL98_DANPL|nr:hypothetical protein KGM_211198 [Danaus plexippus plexippus]
MCKIEHVVSQSAGRPLLRFKAAQVNATTKVTASGFVKQSFAGLNARWNRSNGPIEDVPGNVPQMGGGVSLLFPSNNGKEKENSRSKEATSPAARSANG